MQAPFMTYLDAWTNLCSCIITIWCNLGRDAIHRSSSPTSQPIKLHFVIRSLRKLMLMVLWGPVKARLMYQVTGTAAVQWSVNIQSFTRLQDCCIYELNLIATVARELPLLFVFLNWIWHQWSTHWILRKSRTTLTNADASKHNGKLMKDSANR